MNRFFRRILLSVWLTVLAGITLAYILTRWLPPSESDVAHQVLVNAVSSDLQQLIAQRDPYPALRVAERHALSYEDLFEIFLINKRTGEDIEGRSLPGAVKGQLELKPDADVSDDRITLPMTRTEDYIVIGYQRRFPMDQAISRTGGRPVLLLTMIVMSVLVSYILARYIVLPVQRLREAGHQVAAGDLSVRVAHTVGDRQDEIAELARDFDTMTERIGRLLNTQRRLMRDVSHELRSPLARLQALQSLARQRFTAEDQTHILDRMDGEFERLNVLIEKILTFAQLDSQQGIRRQFTDLADLIRTIVDDVHVELGKEDIVVRQTGPERLTADVDASLIHSAIENIVRNAVRFSDEGSVVEVILAKQKNAVEIVVEDDGPGVPDEALSQLFGPFYQVDDSRSQTNGSNHSGVGLAIARRAVHLHNGSIRAENRESGGLRVILNLPDHSKSE